jgi:hypothetical protein
MSYQMLRIDLQEVAFVVALARHPTSRKFNLSV